MASLKDTEIVIVGGGIVGCSIAYFLTRMGKRDVAVLERSGVTHGSTWHAAGNIGQLRSSANLSRIARMSVELYATLEAETGASPEWHPVGCLRVASSADRWLELKAQVTSARTYGLEVDLLSASEAKRLYPPMSLEGVVGASFTPSDGWAEPASVTQAIAKGARMEGAVIHEGVRVVDLVVENGRVSEVVTDHGTIRAAIVVDAAGIWGREVGAMAGVAVPVAALENQYIVTRPIEGLPRDLPVIRDNDNALYARPEVGGLLVGAVDRVNPPFGRGGIPPDFGRELLPGDWDRWAESVAPIIRRLPVLGEVGVRSLINGPLPTSPDAEPILGPVPGLANFYLACGVTAGIGQGGGLGRVLAEWIVEGRPSLDLWRFDCRRFAEVEHGETYVYDAAQDAIGHHYEIHYPGEERGPGIGARRSPLHDALAARGAVWGRRFGWTRPNWFAPPGAEAVERPGFERPNWLDAVAAEHRAARERVGLADLSDAGKFEVAGPAALGALQRLAAADLDVAVGVVVACPLCNPAGGVEADLRIARLGPDRFYLIGGAATTARDLDLLARGLSGAGAAPADVSTRFAAIAVLGPDAAAVLADAARAEIDDAAFPPLTWRALEIGYARVRALRHSLLGAAGFELHVPVESACRVYERLRAAGAETGVAEIGHRALESLRIEAGLPVWGAELSPDLSPFDAGQGRRVALGKGDFTGRAALARIAAEGPAWRLSRFALEAERAVFGGEALVADGEVVGAITSAVFGPAVERPLLLGYLPTDLAAKARTGFEIEAFAARHPARYLGPASAADGGATG